MPDWKKDEVIHRARNAARSGDIGAYKLMHYPFKDWSHRRMADGKVLFAHGKGNFVFANDEDADLAYELEELAKAGELG